MLRIWKIDVLMMLERDYSFSVWESGHMNTKRSVMYGIMSAPVEPRIACRCPNTSLRISDAYSNPSWKEFWKWSLMFWNPMMLVVRTSDLKLKTSGGADSCWDLLM